MPIYEYSCDKCEKTIEAQQKINDPPLKQCPDCGGPVTRLISRTSFQLKGTGWYASDYKKTQPKPASTPEAATVKAPEGPAPAAVAPAKKDSGGDSGSGSSSE